MMPMQWPPHWTGQIPAGPISPIYASALRLWNAGADSWCGRGPRHGARCLRRGVRPRSFRATRARFGLDRGLPEAEQAAREAEQMGCPLRCVAARYSLPGFVEAQRLRDAALAEAALEAAGGPWPARGDHHLANGHARRGTGVCPAPIALVAASEVTPRGGVFPMPSASSRPPPEGEVPFESVGRRRSGRPPRPPARRFADGAGGCCLGVSPLPSGSGGPNPDRASWKDCKTFHLLAGTSGKFSLINTAAGIAAFKSRST